MISRKSPNVPANEEESHLQKGEQPPRAGKISKLSQALKLWGQKHTEETGTTGQRSFKILISRKKHIISLQSCPLQTYF